MVPRLELARGIGSGSDLCDSVGEARYFKLGIRMRVEMGSTRSKKGGTGEESAEKEPVPRPLAVDLTQRRGPVVRPRYHESRGESEGESKSEGER